MDSSKRFSTAHISSRLKRKSWSGSTSDDDTSMSELSDLESVLTLQAKRPKLENSHDPSRFEQVPTEILNQIVSYLPSDQDLSSLTQTCKSFQSGLVPLESAIWKERFLARYDHPDVCGSVDFGVAYQLRRFVLRNFVAFVNPKDKRLVIQMELMKDMVIETYFQPKRHLGPPITSRNLAAFASPHNSQWMVTFLSSPFFPSPRQAYGQPHPLFDALQLVFSHLLLSPAAPMSHSISSTTANYDLAIVYNWNRPLSTLYRRLPEAQRESEEVIPLSRKMFPNLRSTKIPRGFRPMHELDTHSLLHIRNFWHRHLTADSQGFKKGIGHLYANTYAKMARDLMRCGITPKKWDRPLQSKPLQIPTEWYGHYSCVHPWPRKRQDLDAFQSCAEDWQETDPLKLDFSISTNNGDDGDGLWAPIFRTIPVFANTVPDDKSASSIFIRGLAPFVQLPSAETGTSSTKTGSQSTLTVPKLPKYHPYLSLRLRGVIHSIPPQPQQSNDGIPGWSRIAMVLYKPSKRYLIQVLEHAEEEFGGQFGPALTNQLIQAGGTGPSGQGTGGGAAAALDPAEVEKQLEAYLCQKLLSNPQWRDGTRMDRDTIEEIEERFRLSEFLDWNDIDYAYAYEGAVLPGGKIMMGRWWQVGLFGEGEGLELHENAADDIGVEDVDAGGGGLNGSGSGSGGGGNAAATATATSTPSPTASSSEPLGTTGAAGGVASPSSSASGTSATTTTNASRYRRLNRGPFVFWC